MAGNSRSAPRAGARSIGTTRAVTGIVRSVAATKPHAGSSGTGRGSCPVGTRVLDYLARYLFRVAISNSRLEHLDDDQVTFRYRDNRTQAIRHATLAGVEFLRRFVQHVLPRRCMKVRYYGLWSAARRSDLDHARDLLQAARPTATPARSPATPTTMLGDAAPVCPLCHVGTLTVIAIVRSQRKVPP